MQQNYYIQLDSSGHITDISNTYKPNYVPVFVDLGHINLFQSKNKRVTYNSKEQALEYAPVPFAWGVYYDGGPNPQLKRIDRAVGLHAGINSNPNDFDHISPWKDIHEVKDDKGNQYMSIPPFYVHRTQNSQTGAETLEISPKPFIGWYLPKCFINPKDHSVHAIWVGKYLGNSNGILSSKTGQSISNNAGIDTYRSEMEQNNPNDSQNGPYSLMDIHTWCALQDLFTIEFATLDSGAVFYNEQGDNIKVPTSQSALSVQEPSIAGTNDKLPGSSNWNNNAGIVDYRGIENIFGYDSTWCDGINGTNVSVGMDYTKYNDNGNGYVLLNYSNLSARTTGTPISREGFDSKYQDIRVPDQVSNSSSEDYGYYCADDDLGTFFGSPLVSVGGSNEEENNTNVSLWLIEGVPSTEFMSGSARLIYHPQN